MEEHIQLKKTGLKATLPRIKILDIFQNSKERHLSAEDIYKLDRSCNYISSSHTI